MAKCSGVCANPFRSFALRVGTLSASSEADSDFRSTAILRGLHEEAVTKFQPLPIQMNQFTDLQQHRDVHLNNL